MYKATGGGSIPMSAFVRTGGTYYHLNDISGPYGSCISALNTSGQAVGWLQTDIPPRPHAAVWTYTISDGSVTAQTFKDLQYDGGLATAYPGVLSSTALAINSTGKVVVAANNDESVFVAPYVYGHRHVPLRHKYPDIYVAGQPPALR